MLFRLPHSHCTSCGTEKIPAWELHYSGSKKPLAHIVPDKWPDMFRVRWPDGSLSDLANLSRCRDAAAVIVERGPPRLNAALLRWRIKPVREVITSPLVSGTVEDGQTSAALSTEGVMTSTEQFETRSKIVRGRGMAQRSLDLIEAMHAAAKDAQPITGRGIGYKLFAKSLIASMARPEMARVYRLLKGAREQRIIPWNWIVDETREQERVNVWDDPEDYAEWVAQSYRRDFWLQQPRRVLLISEKGTVRGVLAPVLDYYAVGFLPVHGFSSATAAYDLAQDDDGRPLIILYVGDYDPSGMYMSEVDLPGRFAKYGGEHITLKRIALTRAQVSGLQSFPAADKRKDPRFKWFVSNYGNRCWELDAMDPNALRTIVRREIKKLIEPTAWRRCEIVNEAEQESLRTILSKWGDQQ